LQIHKKYSIENILFNSFAGCTTYNVKHANI